ncbi:hypothetical protein [Tautonia sociabilis]|uniref:Uncharacterized protein n=1 Tax=Tautonia sociabilis TaxID=2080755 RepID=A0A432MRU0_9BACT|nr:hypothetical protein [Tautonia sociabilis]RUL89707.1 hypothetical protein TsocGM_00650 [Tautonia sociabilis]
MTQGGGELADQARAEPGGVTLFDGIALVAGAAIASVHFRQAIPGGELAPVGWALLWLTFAGVALTASGPFLAAVRRLSGRPGPPCRLGDRLWALMGAPWVLAALSRVASAPPPGGEGGDPLYELVLVAGLAVASVSALAIVWARWVMVPPGAREVEEPGSWSHRIGLALGVAWPVQCGLGMVVLGAQG